MNGKDLAGKTVGLEGADIAIARRRAARRGTGDGDRARREQAGEILWRRGLGRGGRGDVIGPAEHDARIRCHGSALRYDQRIDVELGNGAGEAGEPAGRAAEPLVEPVLLTGPLLLAFGLLVCGLLLAFSRHHRKVTEDLNTLDAYATRLLRKKAQQVLRLTVGEMPTESQ